MLAVSRIIISVSVGEEDRQTLTDIMRNMFYRFLPIQCAISAVLIALAVPMTRLFYQDPSQPVFMMTVWGLRILPLCMPFSVIVMHFMCYGQISKKDGLVNLLALLDGVVDVVFFTWVLIRFIGQNSIYVSNVLNGLVTTAVIIGYAWLHMKRFPKTMEELMVIPEEFGVAQEERLDLTVRSMEDVVLVAQRVQSFCAQRGIDKRRAYFAGLCLEEMAGNVVDHGFTKDRKRHSVDIRVVHRKDDTVLLRIKDDCVPFDPGERQKIVERDDPVKNIGIRLVFRSVHEIQYQNILGLNVTTIVI